MVQQFNQLPEVVKVHTDLLIQDKNLHHIQKNVEQYVQDIWNYDSSQQYQYVKSQIHSGIQAHLDLFTNEILTHKRNPNLYVYNDPRLTLELSRRVLLKTEQTQFAQQKDTIDYLQARINELLALNQQKSERIFQALSHLLPEKELLRELIQTHLALVKYEQLGNEDVNYSKQKCKYEREIGNIKDELKNKLSEEQMNDLENILNDFRNLVEQELELEAKLQQKQTLIEKHELIAIQIDNPETNEIVKLEKTTQQSQTRELIVLKQKVVKIFNIQGIYAEGDVNVEGGFIMEQIELNNNKY
jgi:hypothetical protein